MNVEYTGRQFEITPLIRTQVDAGIKKIEKLLGSIFDTHVILSASKHRHIAEITVAVRNHPAIVGLAEESEMSVAVSSALDRIERQAVKYKTRWKSKKRQAQKKLEQRPAGQNAFAVAVSPAPKAAAPVMVHSFPGVIKFTEAHVVKSADSVSFKPLTVEEAVKEAEFRDREVFVFRDLQGLVKVLHRTRDGKMELIEAP
ncbi:MAG TPA: ribosome-associated translation inhibitor RaiA [Candidatus Angelobacter sp.]|nr:ribosome-associated translation inhibitor RaiA [Candidatus Angelobacter sp.]